MAAGLTRTELGRRAGVDAGTICYWETRGQDRPRRRVLPALVAVLGPELLRETGRGAEE
jgi:hypothetical protein